LKFFAKLNRGVLLSAAVVIAAAVYLIVLEASHSAAKPEIQRVCRSYTTTVAQYMLLPQKYRLQKPNIPKSELTSYESSASDAVKSYYAAGALARYDINLIKKSLDSQAAGSGTVYTYSRKIKKFNTMTFDGDTVTVSFTSELKYDGPLNSAVTRSSVTKNTNDTMTLKNENGKWRVVYSSLQQPETTAYSSSYASLYTK
jgi:hypothetical protein